MTLFGGLITISNISLLLLVTFAVILFGYLIGRISVKGVALGDAGVFIIALLFGALLFFVDEKDSALQFIGSSKPYDFSTGFSIIESLGLILFVTSVGYIAGPKFFGNFKKNFKSYVLLGIIIIFAGGLSAAACIYAGEIFGYGVEGMEQDGFVATFVVIPSGVMSRPPF